MLQVGDQIAEWVVTEELERREGSTSQSVRFKAQNTILADIQAQIKVLQRSDDPTRRESFFREVQALHRLHHQNLVRVQGFGEDKNRELLWIATEWVDGDLLMDVIPQGPMRLWEALMLLDGLVEAIAQAHRMGLYHRNICPNRVVVDSNGIARIVDFAITTQGEGACDPDSPFVPPEARTGELIEPGRADVFALGALLFACLTGRMPDASEQQRAMDPGDEFSDGLREVIRDATAPSPRDRIASAKILHERLRTASASKQWDGNVPPPEASQAHLTLSDTQVNENTWSGVEAETWAGVGEQAVRAPDATGFTTASQVRSAAMLADTPAAPMPRQTSPRSRGAQTTTLVLLAVVAGIALALAAMAIVLVLIWR